ncbi:MAG: hypothetical protein P8Y69_15965 [Gammaproteobacteria bacterium]|jgi:hypothetical protein
MNSSNILLVGIKVSVTLAGFAGIVATFQFRNRERIRRPDLAGLTTIVQNSFWCAFGCVLPLRCS